MTQINQPNEDHNNTAAVLGFANNLSQQLMPKAPQKQENGATNAPQQQNGETPAQQEKVDLEANNKEMEKMMDSKLTDFKKEIEGTIKEQIGGIKDTIQEALNEDKKEDGKE